MKTPDVGDIVWLDFDPQAGHEQAKRRPALVLSPASYNGKAGLAVVVPITSTIRGYPFEVRLDGKVTGAVLADQLKSLDWRVCKAVHIEKATKDAVDECFAKIAALLQFENKRIL